MTLHFDGELEESGASDYTHFLFLRSIKFSNGAFHTMHLLRCLWNLDVTSRADNVLAANNNNSKKRNKKKTQFARLVRSSKYHCTEKAIQY